MLIFCYEKNHIKSEIIVNINNKNLVYRPTYTKKM